MKNKTSRTNSMKLKKVIAASLAVFILFAFTGCKTSSGSATTESSKQEDTSTTDSSSSGDLNEKLNDLYQQENQIFADHKDVWDKAFGFMSKNIDDDTKNENYADFLANIIESNKDSFSEEEYATLSEDIETIRGIEEEIAKVEKQLEELKSYISRMEDQEQTYQEDLAYLHHFMGEYYDLQAQNRARREQGEKQVEEIKASIEALEVSLANGRMEVTETENKVKEAEAAFAQTNEELAVVTQIYELNQKLEALRQNRQQWQAQENKKRSQREEAEVKRKLLTENEARPSGGSTDKTAEYIDAVVADIVFALYGRSCQR